MGAYTTALVSDEDAKRIIFYLNNGYEHNGVKHRGNYQIATIMKLQANLGCRIGDIVELTVEDIAFDGESWRLNMIEEKTGKKRWFVIPTVSINTIHEWMKCNGITSGRLFSIGSRAVHKQMRAVTAFLGLPEVSTHSFRKAATMRVYKANDCDIAAASQFLNHKSPATTMIYLRRSSRQMDDIVSKAVLEI